MRISYFMVDSEQGIYFHTKKEALEAFRLMDNATSIEKHTLTEDCFERAYNGRGGFILEIEVIKTKPQL